MHLSPSSFFGRHGTRPIAACLSWVALLATGCGTGEVSATDTPASGSDIGVPGEDASVLEPDAGADPGMPDASVLPGAGEVVFIRARPNGMIVSAEDGGSGPLTASRFAVSDWEAFELFELGGEFVMLRARANGRFVAPRASDDQLVATEEEPTVSANFRMHQLANGAVSLQSVATGRFVSADLNGDGVLVANRDEVGDWEELVIRPLTPATAPDFGPNVAVFDPAMDPELLQRLLDELFTQQETNQFGEERRVVMFRPGRYPLDVNVGFFTHVMGLGASPDDVTIEGAVRVEADWFPGNNGTQNFWRAAENLAIEPSGGANRWAVSQAAPFRRIHVRGDLILHDDGWVSGGFLADSVVDGEIDSGPQQQWLTRNTTMGSWRGANWNMVFVGDVGAPEDSFPTPPYTNVGRTPVLREKPYLVLDAEDRFVVVVPQLRTDTVGHSWGGESTPESVIPLSDFHVAHPGESAAEMNEALAAGQHLFLTPGEYHLDAPIEVTQPNTVVLGIGLATIVPADGAIGMTVADVDGVKVAGVFFDAGEVESPVLMEVGSPESTMDHAANPISLHDVFFRIGGARAGKAVVSLRIHSDDVIGDHFWIWRADHADRGGTVGWDINTAANGLVVEGDDVTIYGLFVEHYQAHQTIWNGERGRTYFYQNEIPYDVPNQEGWMDGGSRGFAAYKVGDHVTTHEAWGLGSYCFFQHNPDVVLERSFEVPDAEGVRLHHMTSVSLGGTGTIAHVVNERGGPAAPGNLVSVVEHHP